jgi:hypothetical protein
LIFMMFQYDPPNCLADDGAVSASEPFLFRDRGSPAEYGAGLKLAIERGWLKVHESGTFVIITPAGAEPFA